LPPRLPPNRPQGSQEHENALLHKFDKIAATALAHGLTVVTRNVRDFRAASVDVFDPNA
jgi:hypothetical protein